MDPSQMRVRPGFLLGLLAFLGILGWLATSGSHHSRDKRKAMIIMTESEERSLVSLLRDKSPRAAVFTGADGESTVHLLSPASEFQYSFTQRTNVLGAVMDAWHTPYRIALVGQTNFIIRSAGPDQSFGGKDDIVFNSVPNDFAGP